MEDVTDYIESAVYVTDFMSIGKVSKNCSAPPSCYGCRSCKGPNCKVSESPQDSRLVGIIEEAFE